PPGGAADDAESRETIDHLIELGYAVPENKVGAEAANHTREMNWHHLARALIDAGENARAVELLEPLLGRHPTHIGYAQTLFQAYLALGRHADARHIAERALSHGTHAALAHLALGAIDLAERRPAAALEHLERAECANAATPALHVLIGRGYLRLRRWEEAERAFRRALQLDTDSEAACHGLATVALARERNEEAAELALRAVGLRPEYPEAHYHLGIALMSLGRHDEAAVALKRSLALRPGVLAAYRRLAELYDGPLHDPSAAQSWRRDAQAIILQRRLARRIPAAPPWAKAGSQNPSGPTTT
ncbi:MAG: tetratricopeptide repeat protein, partial [Tepidisphaeraceae bacterium]